MHSRTRPKWTPDQQIFIHRWGGGKSENEDKTVHSTNDGETEDVTHFQGTPETSSSRLRPRCKGHFERLDTWLIWSKEILNGLKFIRKYRNVLTGLCVPHPIPLWLSAVFPREHKICIRRIGGHTSPSSQRDMIFVSGVTRVIEKKLTTKSPHSLGFTGSPSELKVKIP